MNAALPEVRAAAQLDSQFAEDVLAGLRCPQKAIPCTWLYDRRGSELFEEITQLDAYYPTRAEKAIMQTYVGELSELVGEGANLIEIGAGSITKTHLVLAALKKPKAYVPIDISADFMLESLARLRVAFPDLNCIPVVGDFTARSALENAAAMGPADSRKVAFFPGSTIGNFTRAAARTFLTDLAQVLGANAVLAIGVDATHDTAILQVAYDDPEGVTAAFNLNLLERINRELEGSFELSRFHHEARVNHVEERVEMHLVSAVDQHVNILGERFDFRAGESIHTENSYKYGVERFEALAKTCGWQSQRIWRLEPHAFEFHVLTRS
jgi:dimethylhistidine N-methyltransferase